MVLYSAPILPLLDLAPDSPLRIQGNLTGIPRKLKDLAADWYNGRIKWNKLSHSGFTICGKIGNIKTESLESENALPDSLLPVCDELQTVVSSFSHLIGKMNRWTESVLSIQELLTSQNKQADVIFQTWRIDRFVSCCIQLSDMYSKEHRVKLGVLQNICHSSSRDEILFLLAAWNHHPYLEDNIMVHIDAMAAETGHSVK